MKTYKHINEFTALPNAVVTIGTFDGVHLGHRKILQQLESLSNSSNGETVLLTFFPHPRLVLQPDDNDLKLLSTLQERIHLLEASGIDHLIVQPFDTTFARFSAHEFVRDVLVGKIGTKILVIGYDHHFGRNREGNFKNLEELAPIYNYNLVQIPEHDVHQMAVSSTKIRQALLCSEVHLANELLGYQFEMSGKVVKGDQIGRTIGFPTANIQIAESYKLIPASGIYAVRIRIDKAIFNGMLYIGNRPVIGGGELRIEVNIFDFSADIYGKEVSIALVDFIRPDQKIDGLEALKQRLEADKIAATKALSLR